MKPYLQIMMILFTKRYPRESIDNIFKNLKWLISNQLLKSNAFLFTRIRRKYKRNLKGFSS
jgi:hypothetical protein